MKFKPFFYFLCFFVLSSTIAQQTRINWTSKVTQENDSIYIVDLLATIEPGWHLYSQHLEEGGPLATTFSWEPASSIETLSEMSEGESHKAYEEIFMMETAYFEKEALFSQRIKLKKKTETVSLIASYQICDDQACIFEPGEKITISLNNKLTNSSYEPSLRDLSASNALTLKLKNKDLLVSDTQINKNSSKGSQLFQLFVLGFLGGLIALLTPCVFPMIPLTVSFFTKKEEQKSKGVFNAILYGFFIVFIYFLLSLPFYFIDSINPEILNSISTNVTLNIVFFIVFIVFALSFFGLFEITLPYKWGNKMDNASQIGGVVGTFFMALTLSIVSFSCTGPILGSLLVGALSADGGAVQLSLGMLGFGLALALPFTLFALFPKALKALPKSGGWMTRVKVVLGFLEVALALKFISNADMVAHWGLLPREVFVGLWAVLFLLLGLYLLGLYKFPHDSKGQKVSLFSKFIGLSALFFTTYLVSGLTFKTPLNILSGFAPPSFYSLYETESDCPLNLNCFKDFEEGLAYAKKTNKPILLDFTGWACVNCRKMEENVWSDPEVYKALKKYVLISLYVDDRKALEENEQFVFIKQNGNTRPIKTIGAKWATFQAVNFNTSSQPFYVQLSPNLEVLNKPEKYTDKTTYLNWLKSGLNK